MNTLYTLADYDINSNVSEDAGVFYENIPGFYFVLWGMEQPPQLPTFRLLGLLLLFLSFEAIASLVWISLENGLNMQKELVLKKIALDISKHV